MPEPDPYDAILNSFAGRAPPGKTGPLFRWFWDNYPQIEAARAEAAADKRQIDWVGIASNLKRLAEQQPELGLRAKKITRVACYRTFERVKAERAKMGDRPVTARDVPIRKSVVERAVGPSIVTPVTGPRDGVKIDFTRSTKR
jgi:hypothetical protein